MTEETKNQAFMRNRLFFIAVWAAGAFLLGSVAGCGSGTGPLSGSLGGGASSRPLDDALTQDNQATVSFDATVLAARTATGPYLSLSAARAFDVDLANIRAAYPGVADIHARPDFALNEIIINVGYAAPWLDKWQSSAALPDTAASSDLTTGEAALDALLKKYNATRTLQPLDLGDGVYFRLQFSQPLNMAFVAAEFAKTSPHIGSASVNGYLGDGDNLVYTLDQNGVKNYAFSQGYGDCPAGCINRYTRTYRLAPDGTIREFVQGAPPPNGVLF